MVFKSKIGGWFYALEALLTGVTVVMVYLAITVRQPVLYVAAGIFLLIMGLWMVPMWLNTKYVLAEGELRVHCGLSAWRIAYEDILGVQPNVDPSSSPALSMDRVQVRYRNRDGDNNYVSLSPRDKARFMEEVGRRMEEKSA